MQGTRERVLQLIIEHREVRVEELADALGITGAAVRRHLDHLRADGLIDARQVRQPTGRPYHAYHPTEAAEGSLPGHYAELIARMLQSVSEQDVAVGVTSRMAESVAARHRSEVRATGGEDVIAQVTESLKREGILDGWRQEADGFHLVNGSCPYRWAAEVSSLPCESDRKVIELLVGEHVEQVHRIVDGSPICEYLVNSNPNATAPAGAH